MQSAKERIGEIIKLLKKGYPDAKTALIHSNPLELLVATILSAQCTDSRVNIVTKELFKKYRTARDYAEADANEFEEEIHSTGFYRNKAKNIIAAGKMLDEKYGGKVPPDIDNLVELPGVARKTANVVLGQAFNIATGVVVDTHVHRVSQRLGLTEEDDPVKIEQDLMVLIPKDKWIWFGSALIWHGRRICQAKKPRCPECALQKLCPSTKKLFPSLK